MHRSHVTYETLKWTMTYIHFVLNVSNTTHLVKLFGADVWALWNDRNQFVFSQESTMEATLTATVTNSLFNLTVGKSNPHLKQLYFRENSEALFLSF